jgi:hypothetical protein
MSLPEMFDTLTDAGFTVKVNTAHTAITVELTSRKVSMMEIEAALHHNVNRSQLRSTSNGVAITE